MGSQRVRHDWATELNWTFEVLLAQTTCLMNQMSHGLFGLDKLSLIIWRHLNNTDLWDMPEEWPSICLYWLSFSFSLWPGSTSTFKWRPPFFYLLHIYLWHQLTVTSSMYLFHLRLFNSDLKCLVNLAFFFFWDVANQSHEDSKNWVFLILSKKENFLVSLFPFLS